jgi:hypothetical protein
VHSQNRTEIDGVFTRNRLGDWYTFASIESSISCVSLSCHIVAYIAFIVLSDCIANGCGTQLRGDHFFVNANEQLDFAISWMAIDENESIEQCQYDCKQQQLVYFQESRCKLRKLNRVQPDGALHWQVIRTESGSTVEYVCCDLQRTLLQRHPLLLGNGDTQQGKSCKANTIHGWAVKNDNSNHSTAFLE